MKRTAFALLLTNFTLTLACSGIASAQTQTRCAPRPVALDHLSTTRGETRQSIGLSQEGHVVELFAAEDARNFTVLLTRPDGLSCILTSGRGFERIEQPPKGDPA